VHTSSEGGDESIIKSVRVGGQCDGQRRVLGRVLAQLYQTPVQSWLPTPESDPEAAVYVKLNEPVGHPFKIQYGRVLRREAVGAGKVARIRQRN
jgi:hypothetical protein